MNEAKTASERIEDEILTAEVSDEALEASACAGPENANKAYTIAMCTGQLDCPF
jgi:hypothetical protein